MTTRILIKKNTYLDSISLMSISNQAAEQEGVSDAFAAMGTAMNKEFLEGMGLLDEEIAAATPGDLLLVIVADDQDAAERGMEGLSKLLTRNPKESSITTTRYRIIAAAAKEQPEATIAVISVNGVYAAHQAETAVRSGLNVMLFSDNVSIEDELRLKQLAHHEGLLLMGPDCGTAIIDGTALCFANRVRRGRIGIVAASGTGAQEVSVRIHDFSGGISHLLGTGGRDLTQEIGGLMMLDCIDALDNDPDTDTIVVVSKPPAPSVAEKIIARLQKCTKPTVVCFLGAPAEVVQQAADRGVEVFTRTKPAALAAVTAAGVDVSSLDLHPLNLPLIEEVRAKLRPEQRYIRGLFCGGTLCDESMFLAMEKYDDVYSNLRKDAEHHLSGKDPSHCHTFLDFGEDEFTDGKAHPMIDPSNRISRFEREAQDPEVGVIALDSVLGYGAHPDPVGVMLPAIVKAKQAAAEQGRHLEILAYVLGTEADPQNFSEQVSKLTDAGVTWASSSTNLGLLARELVWKEEN